MQLLWKDHYILTPVFAQIDKYVSLCQHGPSNYTLDRSSKRPVATSLGPVFDFPQNPGNRNWTDHQRARTATAVQSFTPILRQLDHNRSFYFPDLRQPDRDHSRPVHVSPHSGCNQLQLVFNKTSPRPVQYHFKTDST